MGMCDPNHLLHFICFKCRANFKSSQEILKCPICEDEMKQVGVSFRAPKKKDKKAWKKIEIEYNKGKRFVSRWWIR